MTGLASAYQTSPIKRARRTRAEMVGIREGLRAIVAEDCPMTVRQVFYQAVVAGLVDKTEADYQNTVARLLLDMRRAEEIPYSWIADNTRWMRKPKTYTGLADFIARHQQAYRRDLWAEANTYVEIWCEKEALAGVMHQVTSEYDVPLMVSRGFASESYLYSAADVITDRLAGNIGNKDLAFIYYFGDLDPSGLRISSSIEFGLRRLCEHLLPGMDQGQLVFKRVAVTQDQVDPLALPTRPTKTEGNRHANGWPDGRGSVGAGRDPAQDPPRHGPRLHRVARRPGSA